MARPKMDESLKRVGKSVSLPQELWNMGETTGNCSQFVEDSIGLSIAAKEYLEEYRASKKTDDDLNDFLENMADSIDAWGSQFEKRKPYKPAATAKERKTKAG